MFSPIAIVGRSCILPGANSPASLWEKVASGTSLLSSASPRRWGMDHDRVLGGSDGDHCGSDVGGYVRGFEQQFDPTGFGVDEREIRGLDPLFQWVLHCAREAIGPDGTDRSRVGAILGNLSFPSEGLSRFAEAVWFDRDRPDPRNRFMSGLPVLLLGQALGLGAECFALDAACASSLYAIKLACDRLHDGQADAMLAGAVNRADDLFIHVGFSALSALSRSGQSRPFHAEADGLLPAEGCAVVYLKRLEDAEAAGDRIYGVIRGVGLSNDGRGRGFLAPSSAGQVRAIRQAYATAGIEPSEVELVECHATGTQVGDATELESLKQVMSHRVAIGSLKSNLGHLITAAGAAGLLKVLGAFEHEWMPPTLNADAPHAGAEGFHLLREGRAWPKRSTPRRAAVSAFGFGGNNAHLVVEDYASARPVSQPVAAQDIAIVAVAGRVGRADSLEEALFTEFRGDRAETVHVRMDGLRFPPNDLKQTLAQQLLVLEAAREAVEGLDLPRESTAVLIGCQADPEVARYGARWRIAEWFAQAPASWQDEAKDAVVPMLEAPGVLGTMPNIPANRINSQLNLAGPSLTFAAEERSGLVALDVAVRGLRSGELDAAVVGAVDLSCEVVQLEASRALPSDRRLPGDATVVLVLERLDDARRAGHTVIAVLPAVPVPEGLLLGLAPDVPSLTPKWGHAHAASGLLHVAAAALCVQHGKLPAGHPWPSSSRSATVEVVDMSGKLARVQLTQADPPGEVQPGTASKTLAFPAHPAPVRLPGAPVHLPPSPLPLPKPSPAATQQTMHPAPPLPPTTDDRPHNPSEHIAAPSAPGIPPRAAIAPVTTRTASPQQAGPLAALAEFHQQLATIHQDYVERNAALHRQFLSMSLPASLPAAQVAARPAPAPVLPYSTTLHAPVGPAWTPPEPIETKAPPAHVPEPVFAVSTPANAAEETLVAPERSKEPSGPTFSREQLRIHASGAISEIYGPQFRQQDGYERQVRMPEPPLLLADRVVGLQAEPGSMTQGTIWTETDVHTDSWYLNQGYMPAGIMIESGQADLMLISYLGVDFSNRSERVYRLLGCDLTYHRSLPKPGDTLRYDIHVDGHAKHGDVRLFFFHYDCRVDGDLRLSVRNGQAGFFTDEELAESAGILWTPEEGEHDPSTRLDPPRLSTPLRSFGRDRVRAFSEGDAYACFGPGYELLQTHNRTPKIQSGDMLFLDEVTHFEPEGGPWKRGYLRAVQKLSEDDWFFAGHFKNDPCMPGTLMFEGSLQAMAFYLAALGYTVDKDGWRFEPVPEHTVPLRCRGQVTPGNQELVYEIFVEEVHEGPTPTLYADILCTCDGLKGFWARRMGLRLVPDWPLTSMPELLTDAHDPKPVAQVDGFDFGYASLIACAWGRPSEAFGPMYRVFDGHRKVARLPGPPYHFMSRVTQLDGPIGVCKPGAVIELEYDVPPDAWYFRENTGPTMPFCVFLEAALQPCGWLASYVGSALTTEEDLLFRNLDGTATWMVEVLPDSGTLRTRVELTNVSQSGGMIIESFSVQCFLGDTQIYDMKTVFGFFPKEAFENQVGIVPSEEDRARLAEPSDFLVDLTPRPARYCGAPLALAQPMLLMLDRITGFWPEGGAHGRGRVRGEKDVDPAEWFFKAHFFQDPVQPGSLGLEALVQLLQFYAIEAGLTDGIDRPRFEPLALDVPLSWKYRGQVVPRNQVIRSEMDVVEVTRDERGVTVIGEGYLWVDELRIYGVTNLGIRIVAGKKQDEILDPDSWIADHRPTFTVPALPLMSMVDRLLGAVPGATGLRDVAVKRWLTVSAPTPVRTEVDGDRVRLLAWRSARTEELSRFEPVCAGRISHDRPVAPELPPLEDPHEADLPYASGVLFHGPRLQLLTRWVLGSNGASAELDAQSSVAFGHFNQALLDAATHAIPHDRLSQWCAEIGDDVVAYPYRIPELELYGDAPRSGTVRCEVRFAGLTDRFPRFHVQLSTEAGLWAHFVLEEILLPKGPLGSAPPEARRAFLAGDDFVEGVSLSEGGRLDPAVVRATDWLPGTVGAVYGSDDPAKIAAKEAVSRQAEVHPRLIDLVDQGAVPRSHPLTRYPVQVRDEGTHEVASVGAPVLDIGPVRTYWSQVFGLGRWPVEDLYYGLIEQFIGQVHVVDPAAHAAIKGRSLLYLGNHQVMLESLLFSIIASALNGVPTVTLAKIEHQTSWLGELIAHCFSYPGCVDPTVITFFDRRDKRSLPRIIGELAEQMTHPGRSVMVHVEGTRSHECRTPVQKMSSAFIDMALRTNSPIVPVRFVGALPVERSEEKLDFPLGSTRQDIWLGQPLLPETLAAIPYRERRRHVVAAINQAGPRQAEEQPNPPDLELDARIHQHAQRRGVHPAHAACWMALQSVTDPCNEVRSLLAAASSGQVELPPGPRRAWMQELAHRLLGLERET